MRLGVTKRTKVDVKGGQHPVWDEEIRLPVMKSSADKYRKLEVSCFAKEHRSDDILGKGTVDISETLRTGEFDGEFRCSDHPAYPLKPVFTSPLDWVSLAINGVTRGDLYLEMTFFASAPAPAGLLVPISTGLTRRPSKLSPSDRLSRPSQPFSPTNIPAPHQKSYRTAQSQFDVPHLPYPAPTSHRASSTSPKGRDSALPPLPEEGHKRPSLPNTLTPGGALRPNSHQAKQQAVPDFLRPGNAKPPPTSGPQPQFDHGRYPSTSPPPQSVRYPPVSASPPRSYNPLPPRSPIAMSYTQSPSNLNYASTHTPPIAMPPPQTPTNTSYIPHGTAHAPPFPSMPGLWVDNPAPIMSFPIPSITPAPPEISKYKTGYHVQSDPRRSPYQQSNEPNLPDPYLQARYQTPLPLPPGSSSPSPGVKPPSLPVSVSSADADRIRALQLADNEAAERKAQEDRDLELARQLDRELNIGTSG